MRFGVNPEFCDRDAAALNEEAAELRRRLQGEVAKTGS